MKILNAEIERKIQEDVINPFLLGEYTLAMGNTAPIVDELHASIPENKRISYGIVHVIKTLSEYLYTHLVERDAPVYRIASRTFKESDDCNAKGVSLGMLSYYGLGDYKKVLPYFESAAASPDWQMREFAQMFFRKLIKRHPDRMKEYLLKLVKSKDANIRRFVGETLRPVQENRWFYKEPDYPLSILKHMFEESSTYPRTSVGNNLSDLAKPHPDLVYDLVKELVDSGDKNSYWIAYRACRNLVKKDPIKVMNLLEVDEYKYKQRIYKRIDYQGN
jgi:3-methyladenine DNA glycosylase AlkC